MAFRKGAVAEVLTDLDLGSSVAELDYVLASARVETSVFWDLLFDRVDLVTGTKGSGKSALYRIFAEILGPALLENRKVVVAHGVQSHGNEVFSAFQDRFDGLSEPQFVDFWCIYLVSLAYEQFVKGTTYAELLKPAGGEIDQFKNACALAKIPEIKAAKSLREIIDWALNALPRPHPRVAVVQPDGLRYEVDIFGEPIAPKSIPDEDRDDPIPRYMDQVRTTLEAILKKTNLSLWLLVDRLDELFPRRSDTETRALRGLLRSMRVLGSDAIRIKVFLRDDILEQVTSPGGFTALTHVAARQADTLRWSDADILTLIVKRLFACGALCDLLSVDPKRLDDPDYRRYCFYLVFPETIYSKPNQSNTLHWIYSHAADGKGVVTPRDVIDLLTRAKQRQQDEFRSDPDGSTEVIIGSAAIRFGLEEVSTRKRDTVLRAEMPHLWPYIERFVGGNTEYSERAVRQLVGTDDVVKDLVDVGFLSRIQARGGNTYKVPFLYRQGLGLRQGRVD